MWADGICRTANNHYTKTVQYQDINYQLSQNEDKTAIFEGWSDFLNYFDSSVAFQLSFLNLTAFADSAESTVSIPLVGDEFDSIRMEYTDMLRGQLSRGNNGIVKSKFAQTIAAALGVKKRRDGYLEGDDMLISWCFGHLAGLADASIYDAKYSAWNLGDLPIIPAKWRHVVRSEKMKQFKILSGLMARKDVTEVVNACDAGREGELIFRDVYDLAGCSKPIKRLWISSMKDEALREGMAHLKDGAEYEGLYHAARCRAKADWLVGINATRFFTLLYHHTLKIGRVMSPTLALIVQREVEICAFTPEPFFTVQLDLNPTVFSEKLKSREEAEALASLCKGKACTVRQITRKQKFESAPKLYDAMFRQAVKSRLIQFNPAEDLIVTAEEGEGHRSLTPYEREVIQKVAKTHRCGLWVRFLLSTGLRPGESAPLQVSDIDFSEKLVKITKAIESGTENIIGPPKSKAGIRSVPLRDDIAKDLRTAIAGKKPTDFVFPQTDGKTMMTTTSLCNNWRSFSRQMDLAMGAETTAHGHIYDPKDVDKQGIPLYPDENGLPRNGHKIADDLVLYCLRHTFCTDLQKAGVPLNIARIIMGHEDIRITAAIYTHTDTEDVQAAGEKLNAYFLA